MRRLRIDISKANSRITEHFQQFDRLRRGYIAQAKFQAPPHPRAAPVPNDTPWLLQNACTSAKISLSGSEYDALFSLFPVAGAANSGPPTPTSEAVR